MHTPDGLRPAVAMPATLSTNALAFAFRDDKLLVSGTADTPTESLAPTLPHYSQLPAWDLAGAPHYLGELNGIACIAVNLPATAPTPPGWRYAGLRALFFTLPEALIAVAGRALQIVEWDRTHRYCGRCGSATRDKTSERAKECPACGLVAYPRLSPAMMVLVTRGRELLLARANRFPVSMYSALAGFVEPGETIEDCIHREVLEEVNVKVGPPRYFGSQSWPFPHSLMIAFTAEYAGGNMRASDDEIADVQWFGLDALPDLPTPLSIARRLIEATVARLRSDA